MSDTVQVTFRADVCKMFCIVASPSSFVVSMFLDSDIILQFDVKLFENAVSF